VDKGETWGRISGKHRVAGGGDTSASRLKPGGGGLKSVEEEEKRLALHLACPIISDGGRKRGKKNGAVRTAFSIWERRHKGAKEKSLRAEKS